LNTGAPLGNPEGVCLPRTLKESKKVLCKWIISLYGSCVRGTWMEGFFTGNYESYVRHVNEGFGNGASLSLSLSLSPLIEAL